MRYKFRLSSLILIVVFIISFTACTTPETAAETTTTETTITETTAPVTTATETTENIKNKDAELFFEAIRDYNITLKAFEYATAVLEIMNDYVDTKTKTLKMTKEEVGNRFMELANKVQMDYMVIVVVKEKILDKNGITEITPDMLRAVDLIVQWQENKKKEYEYTAKYYYGDGAEYDIKADELSTESDNIADEYSKLLNTIMQQQN